MAFDTFTFSNFKSFGPKPQTINRKPLTLVYGPNSVGKSSLLHAMLLAGYQVNNMQPMHKSTDFAGDVLQLGKDKNFIHQKKDNINCTLKFTYHSQKSMQNFHGERHQLRHQLEEEGFDLADFTFDEYIRLMSNLEAKSDHYVFSYSLFLLEALDEPIFKEVLIKHLESNKHVFIPILMQKGLYKKLNLSDIDELCSLVNFKLDKKYFSQDFDLGSLNIEIYFKLLDLSLEEFQDQEEKPTLENQFVQDLLQVYGFKKFTLEMSKYNKDMAIRQAINNKEFISYLKNIDISNNRLSNAIYSSNGTFTAVEKTLINIIESSFFSDFIIMKSDISILNNETKSKSIQRRYRKKVKKAQLSIKNEIKNIISMYQYNSIYIELSYRSNKSKINLSTQRGFDINNNTNIDHPKNGYDEFIESKMKALSSMEDLCLQPAFKTINGLFDASFKTLKNLGALSNVPTIGIGEILKKEMRVQYFSPLRYIPKKSELAITFKEKGKSSPKSEDIKHNTAISVSSLSKSYVVRIMTLYMRLLLSTKPRYKATNKLRQQLGSSNILSLLMRIVLFPFFASKLISKLLSTEQKFKDVYNSIVKVSRKKRTGTGSNSLQLWHSLIKDSENLNAINLWLRDKNKLNNRYQIEVTNGRRSKYSLGFRDMQNDTLVYPQDMGLGISQILPIILASKIHKEHKIYIEQPELHLHPAMQCEIADDFIQSINERDNEFIIETHSEHLLLRIMRRMRETENGDIPHDSPLALTPDDVCLLYVDHNGEHTYVNELELDEDGTLLDPWPNGFFEEGHKERFA